MKKSNLLLSILLVFTVLFGAGCGSSDTAELLDTTFATLSGTLQSPPPPGGPNRVIGYVAMPNTTVNFSIGSVQLGSITTDSEGKFSFEIKASKLLSNETFKNAVLNGVLPTDLSGINPEDLVIKVKAINETYGNYGFILPPTVLVNGKTSDLSNIRINSGSNTVSIGGEILTLYDETAFDNLTLDQSAIDTIKNLDIQTSLILDSIKLSDIEGLNLKVNSGLESDYSQFLISFMASNKFVIVKKDYSSSVEVTENTGTYSVSNNTIVLTVDSTNTVTYTFSDIKFDSNLNISSATVNMVGIDNLYDGTWSFKGSVSLLETDVKGKVFYAVNSRTGDPLQSGISMLSLAETTDNVNLIDYSEGITDIADGTYTVENNMIKLQGGPSNSTEFTTLTVLEKDNSNYKYYMSTVDFTQVGDTVTYTDISDIYFKEFPAQEGFAFADSMINEKRVTITSNGDWCNFFTDKTFLNNSSETGTWSATTFGSYNVIKLVFDADASVEYIFLHDTPADGSCVISIISGSEALLELSATVGDFS